LSFLQSPTYFPQPFTRKVTWRQINISVSSTSRHRHGDEVIIRLALVVARQFDWFRETRLMLLLMLAGVMRLSAGRHTLLTGTTARVAGDVLGHLLQMLFDALRQVLADVTSFALARHMTIIGLYRHMDAD
jgi:hypothetical protein